MSLRRRILFFASIAALSIAGGCASEQESQIVEPVEDQELNAILTAADDEGASLAETKKVGDGAHDHDHDHSQCDHEHHDHEEGGNN